MKFKAFFLLAIIFCNFSCKKERYTTTKIVGKQLPVSDSIALNPTIDSIIKPYRDQLTKNINTVLSYAPETYAKTNGNFNTAIGNLMADVVYSEGNYVFNKRTNKTINGVILNHGGIRSIISKGNITTKTAYQVMPFENSIVVVALKGKQLDSMFTYLSKAKRAHPISNMRLEIDKNYTIKKALIDEKPIIKDKTYYLATSDYLYNGGDGMRFFKPNDSVYHLNYKIRNAMIDYFKKTDTISPKIDNRFIQIP